MDDNYYFEERVLLGLPGWNPKHTALEITTRLIGTLQLPPEMRLEVFRPEQDGDPCWWQSADLPARFKTGKAPCGLAFNFPLFYICGKAENGWTAYKQVDFVCKEIFYDKITDIFTPPEEFGTGIMLAVQLAFIELCRPIKLATLHHGASRILN